jgi:DnaJ domain
MAAADMAAWRRQNSDQHPVEITLVDGSALRGNLLVSRDMTLRQYFNVGAEAFIDFDCRRDGLIVLAKSSIRKIRPESAQKKEDQNKVDALAARRAELERSVDPYKLLGVPTNFDKDSLRKALVAKLRKYHPDRFADADIPDEVRDYVNAMARSINVAYQELEEALEASSKKR